MFRYRCTNFREHSAPVKKKTCRRQAVIYRVVQSVAGCVVGVNCVLKRAECTGLKLIMVKILLKHILHVYLSN